MVGMRVVVAGGRLWLRFVGRIVLRIRLWT